MKRKKALVIGGGPSGLMAAWMLADKFEVYLFDKEKMPGQKFLLAGKGGFNLTNKKTGKELSARYSPAGYLDEPLNAFDSKAFRQWLLDLGIPTFEGSSGRVFPEKGIKPAQVLAKITSSLKTKGVFFLMKHRLISFNQQMDFVFESSGAEITWKADVAILALGGASWPSTGSDGKWLDLMQKQGVNTIPFQPSNCGLNIAWPDTVTQFHTGKPLKNIAISANNAVSRGEALITEYGLEGNAVYPLIPEIRKTLSQGLLSHICIDFKPANTKAQLALKFAGKDALRFNYGDVLKLDTAAMALIKAYTSREAYMQPFDFISEIKSLKILVHSLRPVEEAISSVGGVPLNEMNPDFSLKKFPRIFAIGEMLDWDAPTGGFLLQACFSMAYYAGQKILENLGETS